MKQAVALAVLLLIAPLAIFAQVRSPLHRGTHEGLSSGCIETQMSTG